MHQGSMAAQQSGYRNILCHEFAEFSIGTAKDEEGRLYMVHLFQGAKDEDDKEKAQQQYTEDLLNMSTTC